jgi:hypothetical protein
MANPNRQCRGMMAEINGRTAEERAANAIEASRRRSPEMWEIMEAAQRGEMTLEEFARRVRALQGSSL